MTNIIYIYIYATLTIYLYLFVYNCYVKRNFNLYGFFFLMLCLQNGYEVIFFSTEIYSRRSAANAIHTTETERFRKLNFRISSVYAYISQKVKSVTI